MIDGDKVVVDASIAVKWYIPEAGSDRARQVLESDLTLLAPELMLVEFGNVLWKKIQRRELLSEDASDILSRRLVSRRVTYVSTSPLVTLALEIASQNKHPIYDALYIATAVAQNCRLMTADERLVRALQDTPLEPHVISLASF